MTTFRSFDEETESTVFRDVIFLALAGFVAIVLIILPHLAEPGSRAAAESRQPGEIMVELRWPDDHDADVDLWVQAPGDVPVGYSNKGGAIFNLLRDDLGNRFDATGLNYEVAYGRGVPPGAYTVNLHLYRNPAGVLPVPATIVVSVKADEGQRSRQLLASEAELRRVGQELTVFRFALDAEAALVPGSVTSLPKPLRSQRSTGS